MFGFFKKQDRRSELKADFESIVRHAKAAEQTIQGLVGRGIQAAEKSFHKTYSTASFQSVPFAEQMSQVDFFRKMEVGLNKKDGPIRVMSIGYALFNRWLAAAMLQDEDIMRQFETEMLYFKDIADTFGDESS